MPSIQDEIRGALLAALGLSSSTLSNPDLERQVLLNRSGDADKTRRSSPDMRRELGYAQKRTFKGF